MNYPVTTPYGEVAGYPLNNGFHNGIDYGYPMGTPVVVNGVVIGLSNNTGSTTGPHLHIGKFVNGVVQNPGVGNGLGFKSAVIYDTGEDAIDGKYVRITGDGALWNYLHLESTLVTKGQVLQGDDMEIGYDTANQIHQDLTGQNWGEASWEANAKGKNFADTYSLVQQSQARKDYENYIATLEKNPSSVVPYTGKQLYVQA